MQDFKEIFDPSQDTSVYYTLEPSTSEKGKLLVWETQQYFDESTNELPVESSYEVIASGRLEKLLMRLFEESLIEPFVEDIEEDIRSAWEDAAHGEEVVLIKIENEIPIVELMSKNEEEDEDDEVTEGIY